MAGDNQRHTRMYSSSVSSVQVSLMSKKYEWLQCYLGSSLWAFVVCVARASIIGCGCYFLSMSFLVNKIRSFMAVNIVTIYSLDFVPTAVNIMYLRQNFDDISIILRCG